MRGEYTIIHSGERAQKMTGLIFILMVVVISKKHDNIFFFLDDGFSNWLLAERVERAERWRWQSSSGSLVAYHQLEIKNWFLSWHHTFSSSFFDEIRITDISLVSFFLF